jgi:hypothetical protein
MTMSYLHDAEQNAIQTVKNFRDEIVNMLVDKGEASDDLLNDYPNGCSWHHENHVDKWYDLKDACEVITELGDDYEETDTGLWQGQDMKDALSTCAAFTYSNAVADCWCKRIKQINEEAENIASDLDAEIGELSFEIDDLATDAAMTENEEERAEIQEEIDAKEEQLEELENTLDERKRVAFGALIDRLSEVEHES